jgi:hypothetical protein
VDDCAGTKAIHGNGMGPFANLAIQTPHWNVSMVVVTQQPARVDPSFRNNAETIIVFPAEGKQEVDWVKDIRKSLLMKEGRMEEMILEAWKGIIHVVDGIWLLHPYHKSVP